MRKIQLYFLLVLLVTNYGCRQKEVKTVQKTIPKKNTSSAKLKPIIKLKEIDRLITDLNTDGKLDSIIFFADTVGQYFQKVTVKISGSTAQQFEDKDGWENIYKEFSAKNKNLVQSKRIFVCRNGKGSNILLFGQLYGSGYNKPTLLLMRDKTIKSIALNEIEFPIRMVDLDADGKVELIGSFMGEMEGEVDSLNADIGSYTPFFVYTVTDTVKINQKLTATYNKAHYVWAGLKNIENIRVLHYRDGRKPKLWK